LGWQEAQNLPQSDCYQQHDESCALTFACFPVQNHHMSGACGCRRMMTNGSALAQIAFNSGQDDGSTVQPDRLYAEALHHSGSVRRLKIILPVMAAVISMLFIAVSILRTYLPDNLSLQSATIENGKIVMEKPAISGTNKDGIQYSMLAERALQDIKNPNMITLETIHAQVPVNPELLATVTATQGIYDRGADRLEMTAPFRIDLSNDIHAEFQSALLDIKAGEMTTRKPVKITGNESSIVAQSLVMTDNGRNITFEGAVRVNVNPAAIRKTGN
jgi:lipopolysaccharide export system protein LptC